MCRCVLYWLDIVDRLISLEKSPEIIILVLDAGSVKLVDIPISTIAYRIAHRIIMTDHPSSVRRAQIFLNEPSAGKSITAVIVGISCNNTMHNESFSFT